MKEFYLLPGYSKEYKKRENSKRDSRSREDIYSFFFFMVILLLYPNAMEFDYLCFVLLTITPP
jgi:hypothetical protein